jgi:hypothetical protein
MAIVQIPCHASLVQRPVAAAMLVLLLEQSAKLVLLLEQTVQMV